MRRTQTWLGLMVLGLAAGGCSLTLDVDKKQCKVASDCGTLGGQALYACEDNFCKQVQCATDTECQSLGGQICEAQVCAPALCTNNEECAVTGETCVAGRCSDPQFYCFAEKAPLTSVEPAVLQFTLIQFFNKQPVSNLNIKVCSTLDTVCNSPIPAEVTYDTTNGLTTIEGLENGRTYTLRFTATDGENFPLLDTDYVMQRPVVGLTVEAERFEMIPDLLVDTLAGSSGEEWDREKGLILAQLFGCDNRPLAGVTATNSRAGTLFFVTTSIAAADVTETDGAGQVGFINADAEPGGGTRSQVITYFYGGAPFYSFSVSPRPGVMTFLYMYMPDYGTTMNRAASIVR